MIAGRPANAGSIGGDPGPTIALCCAVARRLSLGSEGSEPCFALESRSYLASHGGNTGSNPVDDASDINNL